MQAIQRGGLWKIETVGEHTAYVAQGPAKRDRAMGIEKQAEKKPVKVIEVDLDLDDEEEQPVSGTARAEAVRATVRKEIDENMQTSIQMIQTLAKKTHGEVETGRPVESRKGAARRYSS
jgi:hypothetical protein